MTGDLHDAAAFGDLAVGHDMTEGAQTIATDSFVAAGTLGLASVVLFVAEPARAGRTSGLRIDAPPGGLGVVWSGTF